MFLQSNILDKYGEFEFDDFTICTLLHSSLHLRIVSVRYNGLQRHFKHHPRQSMLSRMLLWQLISHHIRYVEGISPACLSVYQSVYLLTCAFVQLSVCVLTIDSISLPLFISFSSDRVSILITLSLSFPRYILPSLYPYWKHSFSLP